MIALHVGIIGTDALALSWKALPVHACTFYGKGFGGSFMSCSEPKREGTCKKYVAGLPILGDVVSMYLPEYLIEVTDKAGKSKFATIPNLKKHLELAYKWQEKRTLLPYLFSTGGQEKNGRSWFWHVRILTVPFGGFNAFSGVNPAPGPSSVLPICYQGLSEFTFDQWMTGNVDRIFALKMSPLLLMCQQPLYRGGQAVSDLIGAISGAKTAASSLAGSDWGASSDSSGGCAYPVPAKLGIGMTLSKGNIFNPSNICLGPLGALLPRRGRIPYENKRLSAHAAAWKFSSLIQDVYPFGPSGVSRDDKWQTVYPKSARTGCYRPSSMIDMSIPFIEQRVPLADDANTYIFAIWKKRTGCLFPKGIGSKWPKWIERVEFKAKQTACLAVTS